jgi:hypothetical protein
MNHCIYCASVEEPLSDEHIVPYGLNGSAVHVRASCQKHAAITSAFEGRVLGNMFKVPRAALGLPSRKKTHPKSCSITITRNGREERREVSLDDYPTFLHLPIFPLPGKMSGHADKGELEIKRGSRRVIIPVGGQTFESFSSSFGFAKIELESFLMHTNDFGRMLAKIAWAFIYPWYARGEFRLKFEYALPIIEGRHIEHIDRFIGTAEEQIIRAKALHVVYPFVMDNEVVVRIKLFALFDVPEYLVFVGQLSESSKGFRFEEDKGYFL